jgi:tryptophanase
VSILCAKMVLPATAISLHLYEMQGIRSREIGRLRLNVDTW